MRVFSVPWSNSSRASNIARTEGTVLTPDAVRSLYEAWAAKGVSFLKENGQSSSLSFASFRLSDCGGSVRALARRAFERSGEERIAFLGGDHSITHATFSAFRERYGDQAVIISLDAHPDLCLKGKGEPLHSDWLRRLLDDGLDPRRIVGVGWRDAERDERELMRRRDIRVLEMADMRTRDIDRVLHDIALYAARATGHDWRGYVTIDMDVADPSIVPGVTTPSPGGLDQHQFTMLFQGLAAMKNIRALDVVEIDPRRDESGVSILWVLKVLREMA
ncbi:MAG: arginase family protein [Candidatus Liptonbacteria bacterium]|nr:arginase family protein [Candidatus Liptonbacteria bacterium]